MIEGDSTVLFCNTSCYRNVTLKHLVLVHLGLLQHITLSMKLSTECSGLSKNSLELLVRSFPHVLYGKNSRINLSAGIDDIKSLHLEFQCQASEV